MKSYCPYTNLAATNYPPFSSKPASTTARYVLGTCQYVAKLRTLKRDNNPLLFKINMGAGPAAPPAATTTSRIALDYAFLLTQLGIRE